MSFRFPTAFTILFALIAVIAALTWVVPAGQYEMVFNEILDKDVPVAGTYALAEANPQGWVDVLMAPAKGMASAIDVAFFILIIGGFLGLVTKTGAIDSAIERVMARMTGREQLLIPILTAVFAAMGTIYGAAEETLPFYALLVPIMMRARFDPVVAAATVLLGAGIGTLGSTINPFATVIASDAAGITIAEGMIVRFGILIAGWLLVTWYIMRYATAVRNDPTRSIVHDKREELNAHFLGNGDTVSSVLSGMQKIVLGIFVATFGVMIYGVAVAGWWMEELSALFLGASILVGLVARMSESEIVDTFVNGCRDLLGVVLIIGIARGLVGIMDAGMLTPTVLSYAESALGGLSSVVFVQVVYWIEVALSFLIPSSSGLAVATMPVFAPLADFSGVARELVVTAYQSASGIVNLVTPTSAVVMGGLAIAKVPYERWIKWVLPLLFMVTLLNMAALAIASVI